MEIRRAISSGKMIGLLEELNLDENWRKIFGQQQPNTRFFDIELILRILALYKNYSVKETKLSNYQNMRQFLDEFTAKNKNKDFAEFKSKFVSSCARLVTLFNGNESNIFRLKNNNRMNYLVFDSIMLAVLHADNIKDNDLKDRISNYKQSDTAQDLYNDLSGTTSLTKVEQRLKIACEAILNGK